MEFRPCIDIHDGKVKQIVGSSLRDLTNNPKENFVSQNDAVFFAKLYKKYNLIGGHMILLNQEGTSEYEKSKEAALHALQSYPGGMQIGGGITADNAGVYLKAGASHIIVTSYVFQKGNINFDHLATLVKEVGKDRIVLDLSCRKKEGEYRIVTDRWQTFSEVILQEATLDMLSGYCGEFLIHGVDVEGKMGGIEIELVQLLSHWNKIPITYAGGIHTTAELQKLKELGKGRIHATVGSALTLFGGSLALEEVLNICDEGNVLHSF